MHLPFLIQHATQDLAALLRLPDLVGILVLVKLEKFLVGFERRLGLVQLIVAERTDKPLACSRSFCLSDQVLSSESCRIVAAKIVSGSEVFPIDKIVSINLQCSFDFLFGGREIAFLQENAAQTAMKLGIARRKRDGFAKREDGIVPFFLGDLDIGAGTERIESRRLAGIGAI